MTSDSKKIAHSILEHGLSNLSLIDKPGSSSYVNNINGSASLDKASKKASAALAGLDDVLETLRELISWPVLYADEAAELGVHFPRGILLYGPPGVGKSAAVAAIAAECGASLHLITPASIYGAYTGESERRLRDAYAAAAKSTRETGTPAIVFLDEVDALCPKRDANRQHEARIVGQLLTLLDGAASGAQRTTTSTTSSLHTDSSNTNTNTSPTNTLLPTKQPHIVTVAATSRPNSIDPALRRPGRLDREVSIPIPSPESRAKILHLVAQGMPLADDVDLSKIAEVCHGYTGADLVALCREAAMKAIVASAQPLLEQQQQQQLEGSGDSGVSGRKSIKELLQEGGPLRAVTAADFETARSKVGASVGRGIVQEFPPATWDQIGGCEAAKLKLQQAVEWPITRKDAFKRLGLKAPRGVLLHGPPGCAKTTLARAAATASGATFIPLLGSELYSMYVGEGEEKLREAFRRARLAAPSIIFIDEIDAVVGKRPTAAGAARQADVSSRLLSSFLTEMDGMELATGITVLATTNRPKALDPALLRPGRFDYVVFVPPPDVQGRIAALKVHTVKMPLAGDVDLKEIAEVTELFTGAELAGVCREAALCALREASIPYSTTTSTSTTGTGTGGVDSNSSSGGITSTTTSSVRKGKEQQRFSREVNEVAMRHFEAAVKAIRPGLTPELLAEYADWPPRKGAGR